MRARIGSSGLLVNYKRAVNNYSQEENFKLIRLTKLIRLISVRFMKFPKEKFKPHYDLANSAGSGG